MTLRRLWILLSYWPVKCDTCNGSGICAGPGSTAPHSCCGPCARRVVPPTAIPAGFQGNVDPTGAIIGDGKAYVRPWAPGRQTERPFI